MTTKPTGKQPGLTQAELDAIERFVASYNEVDRFLRKALGIETNVPFAAVVRQYREEHAYWQDGDLLRQIGDVRNAVVHTKTKPYEYLAIPTPAVVQELEAVQERLLKPARAIPTFSRTVQMASLSDSLSTVLKIIHQRDYSQFPAYDHDTFKGLITENGITRWLARHVSTKLSMVELEDVTVGEVLRNEETKKNWTFVRRDTPMEDVKHKFAENPLLEAVLITEVGDKNEKLLGIATRWNILK